VLGDVRQGALAIHPLRREGKSFCCCKGVSSSSGSGRASAPMAPSGLGFTGAGTELLGSSSPVSSGGLLRSKASINSSTRFNSRSTSSFFIAIILEPSGGSMLCRRYHSWNYSGSAIRLVHDRLHIELLLCQSANFSKSENITCLRSMPNR
jgi:hypothetical protein